MVLNEMTSQISNKSPTAVLVHLLYAYLQHYKISITLTNMPRVTMLANVSYRSGEMSHELSIHYERV